jgi:hypothetical protein
MSRGEGTRPSVSLPNGVCRILRVAGHVAGHRRRDVRMTGQVWTYELKTGRVTNQNPSGKSAIQGKRFAREAVYLPK